MEAGHCSKRLKWGLLSPGKWYGKEWKSRIQGAWGWRGIHYILHLWQCCKFKCHHWHWRKMRILIFPWFQIELRRVFCLLWDHTRGLAPCRTVLNAHIPLHKCMGELISSKWNCPDWERNNQHVGELVSVCIVLNLYSRYKHSQSQSFVALDTCILYMQLDLGIHGGTIPEPFVPSDNPFQSQIIQNRSSFQNQTPQIIK